MEHAKTGNSLIYARPPFTGSGFSGVGLATGCTSAATAAIFISIPAIHICGVSAAIIAMVSLLSHENIIGALGPR